MWFKNLSVYELESVPASDSQFDSQLQAQLLRPCAKTEASSQGWVSPYDRTDGPLVHVANGYWLFCAAKEERLLPNSVVKEALDEKIESIAQSEHREVFRKEKARLKEEITFQLLPKAFTRTVRTWAYLDIKSRYLIVDASSPNRAESLVNLLRESLGTLSAVPLQTEDSPQSWLTAWLGGKQLPNDFVIEDTCEMIDPKQTGAVLRCNKLDLEDESIQQHLHRGKLVTKLGMTWQDSLSFVLDQSLTVKRLRPLSVIVEKRKEIKAESKIEQLDADFSLMTLEISALLNAITKAMGGVMQDEVESEQVELAETA